MLVVEISELVLTALGKIPALSASLGHERIGRFLVNNGVIGVTADVLGKTKAETQKKVSTRETIFF